MPAPLSDWSAGQTAWYLLFLTAAAVLQVVAVATAAADAKQNLVIASAAITIFVVSLHLFLDKKASDRARAGAAEAHIVELRAADPPPLTAADAGRALRYLPTAGARVVTLPAKPPAHALFVVENLSAAFGLTVRAEPPATLSLPLGAADDTIARVAVPIDGAAGDGAGVRAAVSATYEFDGGAYRRH